MQAFVPTMVGLVVFVFTMTGAMLGMWLRERLPEHHVAQDAKDTVKVGVGLVATMTALVLGLVTASAKDSFDETDKLIKHVTSRSMALDRNLARYGAEAAPLRKDMKQILTQRMHLIWPEHGESALVDEQMLTANLIVSAEKFADDLRALTPRDANQEWLKQRSLALAEEVLEARWALTSIMGSSIPLPFLVVLVFWLTVTFLSFGLFAPRNATVIATFLVCALSIGSAVGLVLELDGPFHGLLKVSPRPIEFALTRMGL